MSYVTTRRSGQTPPSTTTTQPSPSQARTRSHRGNARIATSTTITRPCPPYALAAIRLTTTTRRTRAMLHSRNSSRPPAKTVTTQRPGPAPRSTIHSTRSSRLTTAMRAEFALPATSTRTITPSSSARDVMVAITRTISSTTTCRGMSTTASTVTSVTRAARAVDKLAAKRTGVRSENY